MRERRSCPIGVLRRNTEAVLTARPPRPGLPPALAFPRAHPTCFSTSLCLCEPPWVLLFGRWSLLGAFHGPCCKRRERKRLFEAWPFLRVSLREQSPYFSNPEGPVLQPLGPASTQSRKDPFCNVLAPRFADLQTLRAQLVVPLAGGVPEQVGFSVGALTPARSVSPAAQSDGR